MRRPPCSTSSTSAARRAISRYRRAENAAKSAQAAASGTGRRIPRAGPASAPARAATTPSAPAITASSTAKDRLRRRLIARRLPPRGPPCTRGPRTVSTSWGSAGSSSILSRRRFTYTFSVLSLTYSPALSQMALRTCSRVTRRPWLCANSSSSRYSSAVSCTSRPALRTTAAAGSTSTSPRRSAADAPEVRRSTLLMRESSSRARKGLAM